MADILRLSPVICAYPDDTSTTPELKTPEFPAEVL